MIAVGVMSGTSLDGIDAACVEIEPDGDAYRIRVLDFATTAWDASLRARLLDALPPNPGNVAELARLKPRLLRLVGEAGRPAGARIVGHLGSCRWIRSATAGSG